MEVPDYVKPPKEARHYFPPEDLKLKGQNEKSVRFVFYKTEFTPFELKTLQKFETRLAQHKIQLPHYMTKEELIRMLHARRFDLKKAEECVVTYISWRDSTIPHGAASLFPRVERFLNTGAIYIHGQDNRYRPLIVFNLERAMRHVTEVEDLVNLLCFIL